MNELEIADYLHTHPDFFTRHTDLLLALKFASSRGNRIVSLQERQLEVLRDKHQHLEYRLGEVLRNGRENDAILANFTRWASCILAESNTAALPDTMTTGLRTLFNVPAVAMRIWGVAEPYRQQAYASPVSLAVRSFADHLKEPYCGAGSRFADTEFAAAAKEATQWLAQSGAEPDTLQATQVTSTEENPFASMGWVALRSPAHLSDMNEQKDTSAFGLLVMGSPDPQRFHASMATDFLTQFAQLASAALSRLLHD